MFQQLILVGNLGSDPELRYTADGTPVASFSVAVNRRWTKEDGSHGEETTWFRVSAWRKQAEIVNQYLKKGRQVMVVGRVSGRGYTAADGTPRASLDVTADTIKFIGGGPRGEESPFAEPPAEEEVFF
jgi:single-strand DNA-binding protein